MVSSNSCDFRWDTIMKSHRCNLLRGHTGDCRCDCGSRKGRGWE